MGISDLKNINSTDTFGRRIKDVFVHTKYRPGRAYFDVGIAEAYTLIEFNDFVRPVCLPYLPIDNDNFLAGEIVTTAGFGYTALAGQGKSVQADLTSNLKLKMLKVITVI